ncbi:MAG: murein biosynthesis integral membrane protein MurJ [Endomicrobium sp.]|jgi:putative peptidoglycan lipid II flippase|nr:murein biosynthesis integral membrane protein MurJ [Endomicrobium sp.]
MEHKIFVKNVGKISFGTMLSRIFGYIRDMLVAYFFGTGVFADAFYVAFKVPNLFRRVFGEGSFSVAFMPVFCEYLHIKDKNETQKFLNIVFTALFIILFMISVFGVFFAPTFARIIAWGFTDDTEKIQLTIDLIRLMFPFILFICLAAFLLAILNTLYSFFIPALAPSMLSFSEIFYMLTVAPLFVSKSQIKGLAVSIIVGSILHFFVQYLKLKSLGWHLKFMLDLKHPGIKKIAVLMLPSLVGLSADQINAFVDNICATLISRGAVSALYYSNRVMQLPLAIFGLAFAAVSLTSMSKAYAQKDIDALKSSLNYSIRFINFTLFPAAAGLMTIGLPIIKFLFEHGKFSCAGSIMTNNALFYYSLGLPAYASVKIFANAFYSFQDTKTPIKTSIWAMILHIFLCMIMIRLMDVGGLALATALSSYFNFMLLVIYLRKRIGRFGLRLIIFSSCKSFISSIITAIVAWDVCKVSDNLFVSVPVAIVLSLAAFIISSYILKSDELKILKSTFVR